MNRYGRIKSALRKAWLTSPERNAVKKQARVGRGVYRCKGYKRRSHKVSAKEVCVDHIEPVVNPSTGFTTWDELVDRLFVTEDKLQVLCKECHKQKSKDERINSL